MSKFRKALTAAVAAAVATVTTGMTNGASLSWPLLAGAAAAALVAGLAVYGVPNKQ